METAAVVDVVIVDMRVLKNGPNVKILKICIETEMSISPKRTPRLTHRSHTM